MTYSAKSNLPAIPVRSRTALRGSHRECAFEGALLQEIPHLRNYALSLTKDLSDADDLVQDCILRALEKREQFSAGTRMRRWLFTILRNRYLDGWRQRNRRGAHIPIDDCPSSGLGQAGSQEDWIKLKECEGKLGRVRPVDRVILLLSVFFPLSHKEIAACFGVAEGTIRSRLSRKRTDLRA